MNKFKKLLLVLAPALLVAQAQAADYATVDAAVTAVNAIPASASTAFLGAATIGVGFLIIRMVAKGLKKGFSVG